MKKAVMLSVNPKSCSWIARGIKTVDIRKTRPKLEPPFKVYVYCTKPETRLVCIIKDGDDIYGETYHGKTRFIKVEKHEYPMLGKSQKVIGEFVCNEISKVYKCCEVHDELPSRPCEYWLEWDEYDRDITSASCLSCEEIMAYIGESDYCYAWHISNFKLYDHPRDIDVFFTDRDCGCGRKNCKYFDKGNGYNVEDDCLAYYGKPLFKAPQSWCYVKEV